MTTCSASVRSVVDVQQPWWRLEWRDWVPPALLFVLSQLGVWLGWQRVASGPLAAFSAMGTLACLALLYRRRHPLAVLAVIAMVFAVPALFGWFAESMSQVLSFVVAIFAAGRYGARPWAYLTVPFAVGLLLTVTALSPFTDLSASWGWSLNAVWIFALGAGFRHERQLRERASAAGIAQARAEASDAQLHAARNLHDALSHSLAVIVVQAEVADTYLEADPARARRAIAQVTGVGRAALTDTRNIVALLREFSVSDSTDAACSSVGGDLPGIDMLPELVGRVRDSGVLVTLRKEDELPVLTPQVSHAAYRVIQEGLTNVIRHAGKAPAMVTLTRRDGDLVIEVADHGVGVAANPPTGGNGLTGMRERVTACGGSLTAGPGLTTGFVVRATLPGSPCP